ncbi:three-helix bundle dimerization domain-containing protein [Nocardia sp. NPDC052566]|uniref:three-helix bundle dimerization domain-containing protein n=1 Tax=Nocardia sp. NPDC052566 TaxID=3364330 RepID=UPI0037CB8EA5
MEVEVDTAREEKAMQRMTESLVENFTETHSASDIENAVGSVRQRFDGDPIRDFIPILVERIVRQELSPPAPAPRTAATTAPSEPEPARPSALLGRMPFTGKGFAPLVVAAAVAIAAIAVVIAVRQPDSAPAPAANPAAPQQVTTVRGVVGSEKMAFFEDPKVVDVLARKGIKLEVDSAGSRQIATSIDLGKYDFAFPSSETAAERIQRQRNVSTKYTPFSSPMAIATFRPILDLLTAQGYVRPGPVPTLDMGRYLYLVNNDIQWSQLADNTVYPVRKNILVSTTDPRSSNSAAMYLAIAGYAANNHTIVQGPAAEQAVLPTLSRLFVGQGYTENSTEGPFNQYLSVGMGPTPLVWIYEAQYVEATLRGQIKPDMVLMYPSPTVVSRHTLVPLGAAGDRLGKLLTTDAELQRLAAEHGFRTGDTAQFAKVTAERRVPVATDLIDVIETPTYDTLERLLDGVTKAYN